MSRLERVRALQAQADAAATEAELERMDGRPEDIPEDVWEMIQENGRLATERLHEILISPKFMRLRAGDQAKLISLAQNRAYGMPKTNKVDPNKHRGTLIDVTASELNDLAHRATLPEYKRVDRHLDAEDE